MNIDEDELVVWAKGPGQTEQDQCDNAVTEVKKAVAANDILSEFDIEVFSQGSYRARTNVKQNSDVDIVVCLRSVFFPDYPPGKEKEDYGNVDSEISFMGFKDLVEESLVNYFGKKSVVRGNKAFDIHENSYRVDADVVPSFSRRRYNPNGLDDWVMPEGIGFIPDDKGFVIENWPEQTYSNGVDKNEATSRSYKAMIRIIKHLRDRMQEEGIDAAKDIASFLIESLIWNVPDEGFTHDNYKDDLRYILAHIFNNTMNGETCSEWGEVNELKYLFSGSQPWNREQANKFIDAAWNRVGFK